LKGLANDLGMIPPLAGYDDFSCPIGYEKYTDVMALDVSCPVHSVMVVELLATSLNLYDFTIATPDDVTREFEAHQCLTGVGGTDCGDDTLTMLAFHQEGNCQLGFSSGIGYQVECDNEFASSSSSSSSSSTFLADITNRNCVANNGISCEVLDKFQNTQVIVLDENGEPTTADDGGGYVSSTSSYVDDMMCGLDEWEAIWNNPIALLVGAAVMLITLVPAFSYVRVGSISFIFLLGLLSEALKNGVVIATAISLDWDCLIGDGFFMPSNSNDGSSSSYNGVTAVFLPYALFAFSLTDVVLTIVAFLSNFGNDLNGPFDQFKWMEVIGTTTADGEHNTNDENNSRHSSLNSRDKLYRRIMTFLTLVIFGGMGGFFQLALILEGTVAEAEAVVDTAYGDTTVTGISPWASWMFVVCVSLGGVLGVCLVLVGVFTGNLRMAWKVYKFLVGDIPGVVSSVELAVVLLPVLFTKGVAT
jgi:hypothetical protein